MPDGFDLSLLENLLENTVLTILQSIIRYPLGGLDLLMVLKFRFGDWWLLFFFKSSSLTQTTVVYPMNQGVDMGGKGSNIY